MSNVPGLLSLSVNRAFLDVVAAAEAAITDAGAALMAKIDRKGAAIEAGLQSRPTTLLIFGKPAGGTRLMQALPDSAIDLLMKLLVLANGDHEVRFVGEDPGWISQRHGGARDLEAVLLGMRQVMQHVLNPTAVTQATAAR